MGRGRLQREEVLSAIEAKDPAKAAELVALRSVSPQAYRRAVWKLADELGLDGGRRAMLPRPYPARETDPAFLRDGPPRPPTVDVAPKLPPPAAPPPAPAPAPAPPPAAESPTEPEAKPKRKKKKAEADG